VIVGTVGTKIEYIWQERDLRERLDKVLAFRCGVSRSQLQKWLEQGLVLHGEKAITAKHKLKAGDVLTIQPPDALPSTILPEAIPLEVLYEDGDLLVLNKKPGQVVHPGAGNRLGTLVSALLHHCQGQLSGIGGVERPGIVHRLDKETSGVLVVAKNDFTHQSLALQFANRQVTKRYVAWVLGVPRPASGTWKWNIARHPVHRQKMQARETGGRNACTDYKTLEATEAASFIELDLHTGRTHQIRVHAAQAGYPVVGDGTYGRGVWWYEEAGVLRQLLHARFLKFIQPRTRIPIEVSAPVPEDFLNLKSYLYEKQPRYRR